MRLRATLFSLGVTVLGLAALVGGSLPARAGMSYSYSTINVPGASTTSAYDINNAGQVVGSFYNGSGTQGFLLSGGVYTPINAPGADGYTAAEGINNTGTISGQFASASGFTLSGGVYTSFNVPGALQTYTYKLNDSGQVVGSYLAAGGGQYGFLNSGGTFTMLQVPGAEMTSAAGIDNAGDIVGVYESGVTTGAFLYSGGVYTLLTPPAAGDVVEAQGINNNGEIVGSLFEGGNQYGFALVGGSYSVLNVPGSVNTDAIGVNDAGDIVGTYTTQVGDNYVHSAFLATPEVTPEPASITLCGSGLLGMLGIAVLQGRRRARNRG